MKSTLLAMIWLFLSSPLFSQSPVKGFADLHNHMLAEYSFGGAWFHGSHVGHEMEAMGHCSGNADFLFKPKDHARTIFPGVNELLGKVPGSHGDTGWHLKKRGGYPDYSG